VREAKVELMAERKLREIGKLSEKVEVEATITGNWTVVETETLSKQELDTESFVSAFSRTRQRVGRKGR
jgi:hypothetical protein